MTIPAMTIPRASAPAQGRWRFEFYGTDRLTCRGAQIPIIALGPYPEAAADAWDRARDLMLSPELITSNLLHW